MNSFVWTLWAVQGSDEYTFVGVFSFLVGIFFFFSKKIA
jgi:hypothetical protein